MCYANAQIQHVSDVLTPAKGGFVQSQPVIPGDPAVCPAGWHHGKYGLFAAHLTKG